MTWACLNPEKLTQTCLTHRAVCGSWRLRVDPHITMMLQKPFQTKTNLYYTKNNCDLYLVHSQSIILCQNNVHGICGAGEGNGAGVLAVFYISQDFSSLLGLLHVK